MRKAFKWLGIILGGLVGLLILGIAGLLIYGQVTFKPTYDDRPLYPITADTSPEGVARGEYLLNSVMSCAEACHSPEGRPFVGTYEEIAMGPVRAVFAPPNLTPDEGTGLGSWTDAQIARAIREGVDKDGVQLAVMPSRFYTILSDSDTAATVGYLRTLEPVHNEIPPFSLNAFGKALFAAGMFGPRVQIKPITSVQNAPEPGSVEYGGYLVSLGGCRECHGEELAGGQLPFAEEGSPPVPNLTPAGELVGWSEAEFTAAMRTGKTPSGKQLDSEAMPWKSYAGMTDEDLSAIFRYLQSVQPVEAGK